MPSLLERLYDPVHHFAVNVSCLLQLVTMRSARHRHVFLATPCYGGMVSQIYMQSVLSLTMRAPSTNLDLTIGLLGQDALITRSRNTLLAQFVATDATHILFIDADIGFNSSLVERLLASERDVVGALYPLRAHQWTEAAKLRIAGGEPLATAGLDYVGEPLGNADTDGFVRATFAGTGFLLISRAAVEQMMEAYPETLCSHGHVLGNGTSAQIYALFDCLIDAQTRLYLSEDYAFCARWRALGGEVWLDTAAALTHCGMSEFHGAFHNRFSSSSHHLRLAKVKSDR